MTVTCLPASLNMYTGVLTRISGNYPMKKQADRLELGMGLGQSVAQLLIVPADSAERHRSDFRFLRATGCAATPGSTCVRRLDADPRRHRAATRRRPLPRMEPRERPVLRDACVASEDRANAGRRRRPWRSTNNYLQQHYSGRSSVDAAVGETSIDRGDIVFVEPRPAGRRHVAHRCRRGQRLHPAPAVRRTRRRTGDLNRHVLLRYERAAPPGCSRTISGTPALPRRLR